MEVSVLEGGRPSSSAGNDLVLMENSGFPLPARFQYRRSVVVEVVCSVVRLSTKLWAFFYEELVWVVVLLCWPFVLGCGVLLRVTMVIFAYLYLLTHLVRKFVKVLVENVLLIFCL